MGRLMRLLAVVAVLGLVAVPTAFAAEPGIVHLEFSGTFTDTDFCGTGQTVDIVDSEHFTLFTDPNRPGIDEALALEGATTFTNPANGVTVTLHFAGARQNVFPGDPGRVIETDLGLRTQIVQQGPDGLVTRDAGLVVVDFTFSLMNGEIILEHGPHPFLTAFMAGNDLFCGLMASALGLS